MTDTVILGGGLAGAAAALWLADIGRSATVIEARPRLGGRALSRHWGGAVVEYGGGWIRADHGLMIQLAQRLGFALTPRAPARERRFFPGAACDLAEFFADAAQMGENSALHSMTLAQYLNSRAFSPAAMREIMAWWAISGSGDAGKIGINELLAPKLAHGFAAKLEELAFTVEGGISALIEAAIRASGAEVILNDPAVALTAALSDGASVTLASGRCVQGKTALVALPLNCFGDVRFTPPLQPTQAGLRHLGRAAKLLIRARGPMPGDLATGLAEGLRWLYADRLLPDGSTLIVGFGLADDLGQPHRAQVAQALETAFPRAELVDFDWHDWCADPFARGTWVSPALADVPHYAPHHWQARGNLAFAGSDLYSDQQGWFEGALITAQSAVTAANERLSL